MQTIALQISIVLMLAVSGVFAWVIANSQAQAAYEPLLKPAYRFRAWLFALVVVAGAVITILSLSPWPHNSQADAVTRRIDVKARQWSWDLSDRAVKIGEVIEFRVASDDVNHGFALYDSDSQIVAQIQAMPGFTNLVRHRFTKPGTYRIACLEYCGLVHHGMEAHIDVQAPAAQ